MGRGKRVIQMLCVMVLIVGVLTCSFGARAEMVLEKDLVKLMDEITKVTGLPFKSFPEMQVINSGESMDIENQDIEVTFKNVQGSRELLELGVSLEVPYRYSWVNQKMYCNEDVSDGNLFVLVHELVHLQDDQYYNFENLLAKTSDIESLLSALALIEGHAYWVASQVCANSPQLGMSVSDVQNSVNNIHQDYSIWNVYIKGMDFIQYVTTHSPITIAELFNKPPLYAKLILQPEKYIAGDFTPEETFADRFTGLENDISWYFKIVQRVKVDPLFLIATSSPADQSEKYLGEYKYGVMYSFMWPVDEKPEVVYSVYDAYQLAESDESIDDLTMEDASKMLMVFVLEFANAESATQFQEYNNQVIRQNANIFQYQEDGYDYIYETFPNTQIYSIPGNGDESFLSSLLLIFSNPKPCYQIQIVFTSFQPTEEEVFQVLDQINKRL